jgi:hypothetical protein
MARAEPTLLADDVDAGRVLEAAFDVVRRGLRRQQLVAHQAAASR